MAVQGALDDNNDALSDANEALFATDPFDSDTDDDGLLDGTEVDSAMGGGCPNPTDADSDDDTLADGAEVDGGTNPCNADSDGDGVEDAADPLPTEPGVTSGWVRMRSAISRPTKSRNSSSSNSSLPMQTRQAAG